MPTHHWKPVALALLGPVTLWTSLVLLAAGVASTERINEGCWGPCATSQREGVLLVGGILGVVVVPLATIVAGVVVARSSEDAKLRNAVTTLVVLGVLTVSSLVLLAPSLGR